LFAKERRPECLDFGRPNIQIESFTSTIANRDDRRNCDDASVLAQHHAGRIDTRLACANQAIWFDAV
jgi:hypothetical protein